MKIKSSFNVLFHVLCGALFLSWTVNFFVATIWIGDFSFFSLGGMTILTFLVVRNVRRMILIFRHKVSKLYLIQGYWKDSDDKLKHGRVVCSNELENVKFPGGYKEVSIFHYGMTEKKIKQAIEQGADSEYEWVITSYRALI